MIEKTAQVLKNLLRNNAHLIQGVCLNNLTGHTHYIFALTLLPNGLLVSGAADNTIMIWNITKTSPLYNLTGHTSIIRAFVVINEEYLVSGANDGTMILWSLSNNYTQVRSWQASSSYVLSLAFDSTLNVLASGDGNMNDNVKIWDSSLWANSGKRFPSKLISVFFSITQSTQSHKKMTNIIFWTFSCWIIAFFCKKID